MRNLGSIGTGTKICAVIGNPVEHSLSPAIHNAAYAELDLDFVYVAFRVEDLKSALAGMRALENFRGLSVTIPHKIEALKYLDRVEDVDRRIGSINTIVNEGGVLNGLGTDGPGALKALTDAGVEIDGRSVLFLGAGGAARAIAFTLAHRKEPAEIALLDVDASLLGKLKADLEEGTKTAVRAETMNERSLAAAMESADLVVHCTPVGMSPQADASVVPAHLFRPGQAVFDIVYTPLETKLLRDARSRGLHTISGSEMFVNQAALQFERFTGCAAPVEVMRRVVMKRLRR
jgi:shikimate dehydrogenase